MANGIQASADAVVPGDVFNEQVAIAEAMAKSRKPILEAGCPNIAAICLLLLHCMLANREYIYLMITLAMDATGGLLQ